MSNGRHRKRACIFCACAVHWLVWSPSAVVAVLQILSISPQPWDGISNELTGKRATTAAPEYIPSIPATAGPTPLAWRQISFCRSERLSWASSSSMNSQTRTRFRANRYRLTGRSRSEGGEEDEWPNDETWRAPKAAAIVELVGPGNNRNCGVLMPEKRQM